jgi:hypothetical protein
MRGVNGRYRRCTRPCRLFTWALPFGPALPTAVSRLVPGAEDGYHVFGGDPVQVQVYLWCPSDRGPRRWEQPGAPRHSVERIQGSAERGLEILVACCNSLPALSQLRLE